MPRRVIWKFPCEGRRRTIELPHTASIRLVGADPIHGTISIWVELDPEAPKVPRTFCVYGTGEGIEGDGGYPSPLWQGSYIDTPFVWHVYEIRS